MTRAPIGQTNHVAVLSSTCTNGNAPAGNALDIRGLAALVTRQNRR